VDVQRDAPRIVLAGGGTGGHLYPALAVAHEIRRRLPRAPIVFFGARRGIEQRLVPQAGYPLVTLRVAGLAGTDYAGRLAAAAAAGWAVVRCCGWMLRHRPRLVIGVGGYASGPAVLAGKIVRTRTMVLEQNHYPGATNRWLAPRVDAVCLPSEDARRHVRGRLYVTGNPVRREFFSIGPPPADPGRLRLLAFGGSRGARSINRALVAALDALAAIRPIVEIVHQTGAEELDAVRAAYAAYPHRHEVHAFLDDMPARLAAADLVLCRAGASTLAELSAAGRPALLVPFPHAAADHQRRNAETLVAAGAAELVPDRELDGPRLAATVGRLAADAAARLAMGERARRLARPDAAREIVDIALGLVTGDRHAA
jgi:UDP-N-acetylglucosamine--N-acetylmuramyl-(pentapeptide) pyrophosphoryl-undecaprenol N-acetylglucosamine transferase